MSNHRPGCHAYQASDQMMCAHCGLQWDVGDDDPPVCNRALSSRHVPVSRMTEADFNSIDLDKELQVIDIREERGLISGLEAAKSRSEELTKDVRTTVANALAVNYTALNDIRPFDGIFSIDTRDGLMRNGTKGYIVALSETEPTARRKTFIEYGCDGVPTRKVEVTVYSDKRGPGAFRRTAFFDSGWGRWVPGIV